MKLSIVIPAYNEENTIEQIINNVKNTEIKGVAEKEIIVVNDGSRDKTREILEEIPEISLFHLEKNKGKGAALRRGFKEAVGDIIVVQDADLEYNPKDFQILLEPILDSKAEVVYGSRFLGSKPHRVLYYWHYFGNKIITTLSNMLTNLNLSDVYTGYKAFKREVIKDIKLKENGFGFEAEFTAKVARKKVRMYEVGISYTGRSYEEGKKITSRDGLKAIWCILKYNIFCR